MSENLKTLWRHEAMGLSELTESDTSHQQNKECQIEFNGMRYEVRLPWDSDFATELLPNKYELCDKRLRSLFAKLKGKPDLLQEYGTIFQEQLTTGIIERVSEGQEKPGKIHYLCHHGVIHKDHDTTKLRIVFDASAKGNKSSFSLNDFLVLGNNYMPSLFYTLLHFRCHPVAMTADIEKAFLQIEINPADRDSLRFLWYDDVHKDNLSVIEFRWCRLAFGLKPSPSILGATIRKHISLFQEEHPETVEALSRL